MSDRKLTHLDGWRRSDQWREISRRQARRNLAEWQARPRCGARCRTTGEPCKNPVVADAKRCRLHGVVPKGDQWHRLQPGASAEKTNRKLANHLRKQKKRAKRVAAMTPDERAAYDRWQKTHRPGPAIARERARIERRQNADLRERVERMRAEEQPQRSTTPEAAALERQLSELRAELDRRRREAELLAAIDQSLGVFE